MKIRFATYGDLKSIIDIYNQAVRAGNATADVEELKLEDRREWFYEHAKDEYPIYVLESDDNIVGWASLSPYRKGRGGLKETAEISFYVDVKHQGKGFGSKLIEYVINDCRRLDIKNVFALLLEINKASISILKKMGFSQWGFMPDVVNLNGLICAHLIFGRKVNTPN